MTSGGTDCPGRWSTSTVRSSEPAVNERAAPNGAGLRLSGVVKGFRQGDRRLEDYSNGFPYIVSGLKSLLETGQALPSPS